LRLVIGGEIVPGSFGINFILNELCLQLRNSTDKLGECQFVRLHPRLHFPGYAFALVVVAQLPSIVTSLRTPSWSVSTTVVALTRAG
jgi:hypothetical protein